MPSLTSFEPTDATLPPPTGSADPFGDATGGAAPQTATLPPDCAAALGLTGAAPGTTYTLNVTIDSADENGATVTVNSSLPDESAEPMDDLPVMDEEESPSAPTMPPKPKPAIKGPKEMNLMR